MQIISKSALQTKKIARKILLENINKTLNKSLVFMLNGELGSGKTIFAKGIGEYFGVKKMISPSFIINCEYEIKDNVFNKIYHFDFYNLKSKEYDLIGLWESLNKKNIVIIEWAKNNEKIVTEIKKLAYCIEVNFKHKTEKVRELEIVYIK